MRLGRKKHLRLIRDCIHPEDRRPIGASASASTDYGPIRPLPCRALDRPSAFVQRATRALALRERTRVHRCAELRLRAHGCYRGPSGKGRATCAPSRGRVQSQSSAPASSVLKFWPARRRMRKRLNKPPEATRLPLRSRSVVAAGPRPKPSAQRQPRSAKRPRLNSAPGRACLRLHLSRDDAVRSQASRRGRHRSYIGLVLCRRHGGQRQAADRSRPPKSR